MSKLGQHYELADFVVARSPIFPMRRMTTMLAKVQDADWTCRDSCSIEKVIVQSQSILKQVFSSSVAREALYVASPGLLARVDSWDPSSFLKSDRKVGRSLMKYYSRMTYRCTPFGLFASVSVVPEDTLADRAEPEPGLVLGRIDDSKRQSRIDMEYCAALIGTLLADPEILRSVKYQLNPTVFRSGDTWQYIASDSSGGERKFSLTSIAASNYLDAVVTNFLSENQYRTFDEIVHIIGAVATDADQEDIVEFVELLISESILLSDLEPIITSGDSFSHFREALSKCSVPGPGGALALIEARVARLNDQPIGAGTEMQRKIGEAARSLLRGVEQRNILQTDMVRPVLSARITEISAPLVCDAVDALSVLGFYRHAAMEQFCQAFTARFGDAEVPMLEALDPDSGIPFGHLGQDELPLLKGLPLAANTQPSTISASDFRVALLVQKFEESCRKGLAEVTISEQELSALAGEYASTIVSPSLFLVGTLLGNLRAQQDIRLLVRSIGALSGTRLFGRFCSASGELSSYVQSLISREDAMDGHSINAEVVHWPDGRLGNVILRPAFRKYEIPIFGRSNPAADRQIFLRDLLLSVSRNRATLRDGVSGKEVIPRLTSAHNVHRKSVHLYTFLLSLQSQNGTVSSFAWPSTLSMATRLPRVLYNQCVLSPQTWRLPRSEINRIVDAPELEAFALVTESKERHSLTRFIEVWDGDNFIPIDFDNPLSVSCLISELRRNPAARLCECLQSDQDNFVSSPEGPLAHEIVFPLVRKVDDESRREYESVTQISGPATKSEIYVPGSEWLSLKIYCGTAGADRILLEEIDNLTRKWTASRKIESWFFLRYADPDHHLRVRLRGSPDVLYGELLKELKGAFERLFLGRLGRQFVVDSYLPETHRYGGEQASSAVQRIFLADSTSVLALMRILVDMSAEARWKAALLGVYEWWSSIGLSAQELESVFAHNGVTGSLVTTASDRKSVKMAVDRKVRPLRAELSSLLWGGAQDQEGIRAVLRKRTEFARDSINTLVRLERSDQLTRPLVDVVRSIVHMFVNRISITSGPSQEAVIYELLTRLQRSYNIQTRAGQTGQHRN